MANQLNQLLKTFHLLRTSSDDFVLATIIETMGSTYQKAGARMLIAEDGEFNGLLGGGCFESDLREQAVSVFKDKQSKVVFYDMRSPEDAIWGLGLGCNGAVRIFLQLLSKENHLSPLNEIHDAIEDNQTGILATVCESTHKSYPVNQSIFLPATKQNKQLTFIHDHGIHDRPAKRVLLQDAPELFEHHIDNERILVFYDLIKPNLKLLLLGAGPDAVPVTHLAKTLGWHITVVDHRPAYIKLKRFPDVNQLLNITPAELNKKLSLDQFDALVVMTHSIDYDERYLKVIADSPIPYIGLLGPAKRRDRLLDSLNEQAEQIKGRVYGPTGLDIGASTPEEIALSIMAEIQAVLANRDGSQLSQKDLPIQERKKPN